MYSVLIQNQKTIEYFNEAYPLFLTAIDEQKIGCCRWNENGTTVATTLPDIVALTDDKKEWRAIIVTVEKDEGMRGFETLHNNPYDFKINHEVRKSDANDEEDYNEDDYRVKESEVPLIRLTQMLGGVPAPEIPFKMKRISVGKNVESEDGESALSPKEIKNLLISNAGKLPDVIYQPVTIPGNDEEYKRLCEKYSFNGKRPTEIILMSLRLKPEFTDRAETKAAWVEQLESESSEFWQRNKYPSNCRFLVYDYTKEGNVKKNAYLFEFWSTVLLIATNDIDPSSLQGYRLYNVGANFDHEKMRDAFQKKIDDLLGTKNFLEAELQREVRRAVEERSTRAKTDKNEDRINDELNRRIIISAETPNLSSISVNTHKFPICPKSSFQDANTWDNQCQKAQDGMAKAYRRAERKLDESADLIRFSAELQPGEIHTLDRFDIEDRNAELLKEYNNILDQQNNMPGTKRKENPKLIALEEEIKRMTSPRVRLSTALYILGGIVLAFILSGLPGLILRAWRKSGTLWAFGISLLVMMGLTALIELIVFLVQRARLVSKIREYNACMEKEAALLHENTSKYKDYAVNIAKYRRGSTYLRMLQSKEKISESTYEGIQKHMKAIDVMLEHLTTWSKAYYLNNKFETDASMLEYIDYNKSPKESPLYTVGSSVLIKEIPLNNTGVYVNANNDFTTQLIIEREELFD